MKAQLRNSGIVSDAPVAHSEEQRTFNPRVVRSKLTGGTTPSLDALPARMQSKIQTELCPVAGLTDFCWAWTGCLNSRGYGCWAVNGKSQLTHRVAYILLVGEIPDGLQVDHLCGNKRCCNPDHLEAVTDAVNKSRTNQARKTLCVNGHRLDGDNLIIKKRGKRSPVRNCRTCAVEAQRRARATSKADLIGEVVA